MFIWEQVMNTSLMFLGHWFALYCTFCWRYCFLGGDYVTLENPKISTYLCFSAVYIIRSFMLISYTCLLIASLSKYFQYYVPHGITAHKSKFYCTLMHIGSQFELVLVTFNSCLMFASHSNTNFFSL